MHTQLAFVVDITHGKREAQYCDLIVFNTKRNFMIFLHINLNTGHSSINCPSFNAVNINAIHTLFTYCCSVTMV